MSGNSKPTQNDALSFELTDWLDKTQRLDGAATPGPWAWEKFTWKMGHPFPDSKWVGVQSTRLPGGYIASTPRELWEDAEFIAHARTALPQAVAALRAVADLHVPITFANGDVVCEECDDIGGGDGDWPCPTVQAITEALGEE